MSAAEWSTLPLLPLLRVLRRLSLPDVLAATAACRNWRRALLLYEGRRETLKLRVGDLHRGLFLVDMFGKYARRLHIFVDTSAGYRRAHEYLHTVLPRFFDAGLLYEIIFIGPAYVDKMHSKADFKLNRALVEELIHAQRHTLQHFALFGCVISPEKECCVEEKGRFDTRDHSFIRPQMMPSKYNMNVLGLSSLKHLALEYDMLEPELFPSLCGLPHLAGLSLQLRDKRTPWQPLRWASVQPLRVEINVIEVPAKKFDDLIQNVLVAELPLEALRIFFCNTLHEPIIKHITRLYHECLREVEWTDAPCDDVAPRPVHDVEFDDPCINPFILICWRCNNLERLTIHGYWVWHYDLLGMARLRYTTLQRLQVSATYSHEQPGCERHRDVTRVRAVHRARPLCAAAVQEVNRHLQFNWRPVRRWSKLHPALTAQGSPEDRSRYVLQRATALLDVT